jgi:hypothetical protein
MGRFNLTGPNYNFNYEPRPDKDGYIIMCDCYGYSANISPRLEEILLKGCQINRKDLIKLLREDGLTVSDNVHLGSEKNEIYNYNIKPIIQNSGSIYMIV